MADFHHPNMTESEWNAMKELEAKIMREFDEKLKLNGYKKPKTTMYTLVIKGKSYRLRDTDLEQYAEFESGERCPSRVRALKKYFGGDSLAFDDNGLSYEDLMGYLAEFADDAYPDCVIEVDVTEDRGA